MSIAGFDLVFRAFLLNEMGRLMDEAVNFSAAVPVFLASVEEAQPDVFASLEVRIEDFLEPTEIHVFPLEYLVPYHL